MATILIVDDRAANREFLVTLLGYGGHRLLEAADGAEGLARVQAERPDLVIADILMPTMDGYEFVRRLRADPAIAETRVVFCTAHYHEPEARRLADACGVTAVLTKPCEPEVVLQTVETILGHAPPSIAPPTSTEEFDRDHLHLLTDKLSQKAEELRRTNERLTALIELGLTLGSERSPARLLQVFCDAAREIVGARYAVVGIPTGDGAYRHFLTSGMDLAQAAHLGRPMAPNGILGSVLGAARCFRAANREGFAAAGLPPSFPTVTAVLAAPLVSPARVHGWVCLLDKLGADAFTDEDERFAAMLGAQVGRIYENGSLYADLLRHSTKLAEEVSERQRSEAALRESEERFRGAFEYTGVAMVLSDADYQIVRVNAAFARLFGYTPAEMVGMAMAKIIDPDDFAQSQARRRALVAGQGHFFQLEKRYVHRSGRIFWGLTSVSLVRNGAGEPYLYVGQVQDVTEQKRAEAEVRRTGDLLRAVADETTDGVYVKDRSGRYLLCNAAAAGFVGKSVAEVIGQDDNALFDLDSAKLLMAADRDVMMTGQVRTVEETLTAAGVTRTYFATKGPYRDHAGKVAGVLGISRDITDRKRAEADLRLRDRAIRAVQQGIFITDPSLPDNPIIYVSPGFERLTGYPSAEAVGQNSRFLRGPATAADAIARTRAAFGTGTSCTVELLNYRKDGTPFWNELSLSPVRDDAGALTHFVGVLTDVTARRSLEEQLRQAQKMEAVGQLAGGVAHDFNNLLTVINGYSELVLKGLPPTSNLRKYAEEVLRAGERATGLTRQLLAFSRKAIIEPKVLDLGVLVVDVDRMLRRIVGEDIELIVTADPAAGLVKADPGQIEQVLMNLVVNARDAMPTGGRLTIELGNADVDEAYTQARADAQIGPHVLLTITDTGCGMDAATIQRVFEPFFTTKGTHGTGLGLATVHGIIRQAGGHITVTSAVGRGTTFQVFLPRVELEGREAKARSSQPFLRHGGEMILLVEDSAEVRALAREILETCGYTVLEAQDGEEAIRLAAQHTGKVDLLLTDVVLPHMGGRTVAARVAESQPHAKSLYMSGYTDDAIVRHGILEAEVAFLQKPFTAESLAAKVRAVLDG